MARYVDYAQANGAARITLVADNDSGNPINTTSARELLDAVLRAKADDARVIVLGAKGRFFSVGGDLSSIAAAEHPDAMLLELAELAHRTVTELVRSAAIVVSAVQGTAAGIGFPLAAAADIILAADTARFSLAYTKVGLSPDGGGSLLVNTLGLHRVLRLVLVGDLLTALEAYEAGLVARVVPVEGLDTAVDEMVSALLAGPRLSLATAKRLVRDAAEPSPESAMRREAEAISRLGGSVDGREGVAAFLAKRRPEFS
ncbi:enoyl-CoA hydratase/isomerase family protein [Streptomyces sp. ME19-01-6]|uniref:enoyl-CoA hydratase/isomerase family protein n=1 Tax=Streptomyces sp. ME19-01-6 TaxID=3028686 RepID=UPI0029B691D7|nr:enoyl-CoA hydratase-related protein [Streptomyces sp. ME19-01-6]MDX3233571.1 enoyl-CoA hydratase-related protein [Streptomyces sp. ME19-01-6]